jgi:hypothetical protein
MRLPVTERNAIMNAVAKLVVFGDQLGAPHTSQVKGSELGIRELRPRAGRSPGGPCTAAWRTASWCLPWGPKPSTISGALTARYAWQRNG